jgi:hypothetical protein
MNYDFYKIKGIDIENLTSFEKDPDIQNIHNGNFLIEIHKNIEYK